MFLKKLCFIDVISTFLWISSKRQQVAGLVLEGTKSGYFCPDLLLLPVG